MEQQALTVGAVAKRSGVAVSTLHFYEQKGLISSQRNTGNQRRYRPDVLRRIAVIKTAQRLGISLEEIKLALDKLPHQRTPTKNDWVTLSSHWQEALNQRIYALEKLRDSLSSCIGCGCLSLHACPLYNPDDNLAEQGPGAVILNR